MYVSKDLSTFESYINTCPISTPRTIPDTYISASIDGRGRGLGTFLPREVWDELIESKGDLNLRCLLCSIHNCFLFKPLNFGRT